MAYSKEKAVADLRAAYETWDETKGGDAEPFIALMHEDCTMRSLMGGAPPARFTAERTGREAARAYFAGLTQDLEMVSYTAKTFVADDAGNVVMIGDMEWVCIATKKPLVSDKVDCWTFDENGQATSFLELYDTAALAEAYKAEADE